MTTIRLDTTTLIWLLSAEAMAVLGMALFFYWAVRSVGLFRAAAKGKEFSESVARAKEAIWSAAESAATKISHHDARVLELVRQVDQIADRLKQVTPGSIQIMIDDAAGRKAAAQTAQFAKERSKAQAEAESLKDLVHALTSAPSVLAAHVRLGLPAHFDPKLVGQVVAYCGARGIAVGQNGPSQGPKFGGPRVP